ncbi:MAG: Folylpolyglutamate synthase [Phycisphaerae bacterium]|nr:Folylpolyglutamate synthase [Phycisphaerae bacterium]
MPKTKSAIKTNRAKAKVATPKAKKSSPSSTNSTGIRNYKSALNFIAAFTDYESMSKVNYNSTTFNLARMNRLMASLDNPHRKLKTIHIAGTKGKGSTATMISNMLHGSGYNIGLYTSPHVMDLRERVMVNNVWISESEFSKQMARIAPIARQMKGSTPTFFEIMTALAFMYFVEKKVDLAVIEAGLGGRLDSTNVIRPEVCAITSISYDHMAQLGNSLEKIAEEKAGIFKNGIPAVSAPQDPQVKKVLKKVAADCGALLKFAGDDLEFSFRFESSRITGPHTRVCLTTPNSRFEHLQVPLLGEHQAINCGLALSILDTLKTRGFQIDDQRAVEGLSKVKLPGRMEIINTKPRILVDGAHNAASIEALMRTIGQNINYDSMIVIFGCREGKDIEGMMKHIQLGADKVIFTRFESPLAVDPPTLVNLYSEQSGNMAQAAERLEEAMAIAQAAYSMDDLICITGSFYLVGEAKRKYTAGTYSSHLA